MWGMGNNSNNPNFNHNHSNNLNDADRQQRIAAQMAQLEQQMTYGTPAPTTSSTSHTAANDFYSSAFPFNPQIRAPPNMNTAAAVNLNNLNRANSAAIMEEHRRVEMALAATALQEQEAREQQIRQYEREVAASMRNTILAQELVGVGNVGAAAAAVGGLDMDMDTMGVNVNVQGGNSQQEVMLNQQIFEESLRHQMRMQRSNSITSTNSMSVSGNGSGGGGGGGSTIAVDNNGRNGSNRVNVNHGGRGLNRSGYDSGDVNGGNVMNKSRAGNERSVLETFHGLQNSDDMDDMQDDRTRNLHASQRMPYGEEEEEEEDGGDEDDGDDDNDNGTDEELEMNRMMALNAETERKRQEMLHKKEEQKQKQKERRRRQQQQEKRLKEQREREKELDEQRQAEASASSEKISTTKPTSDAPTSSSPTSATPKKKRSKTTPSSSSSSKPKSASAKKTPAKRTPRKPTAVALNTGTQPNLLDPVRDITEEEYKNLDALMCQFCKVPLLAEFSRPVSLLHPELSPLYHKVVQNPIDLGKVCRAIRRRQYTNTRQVCVDIWRIFSNCVKYHTHPITREGAIPSFVSIANHLREYFNALWIEYMIPSEIPTAAANIDKMKDNDVKDKPALMALKNAEDLRDKLRKEILNSCLSIGLDQTFIDKIAEDIENFVQTNGKVDDLDKDPILDEGDMDGGEMDAVMSAFGTLTNMAKRLQDIAGTDFEYTVEALHNDLRRCYGDEVFERFPYLKVRFEKRLDRLVGKYFVPINEVSCRGVNQSSVWGCMAAAIWARETTKRPYWPALVLGIMAPEDQKEDWHNYLTQRNEDRLPEKLLQGLQTGKKKAVQAINRQSSGNAERMSYFLVEFLGTHEFIWVREADIIENFDPEEDVNQQLATGNVTKKKKSTLRGQTAANARMLQKAIDEGRWALEEFEMLLNNPCGDLYEDVADEEEEEENYSFPVLCESDDEADDADGAMATNDDGTEKVFHSPTGLVADVDEINELIATNGRLDFTAVGRKNAKKRAAALKKQQAADAKKEKDQKEKKEKNAKKEKDQKEKEKTTKKTTPRASGKEKLKRQSELEVKRELKELEKRRKKRERERDRVFKEEEKKAKKMKVDGNSIIRKGRKLGIADKAGRAAGLVRGYLNRIADREQMKGLGLGGVMTLPAANVEGSGILGLALAFRAAAGELEMPNADDNPSSAKPWDLIDVTGPKTSKERCQNLEKKIAMLESALDKLNAEDAIRKSLIEAALKEKEEYDKGIYDAEKIARQNDMPKRKVSVKRKSSADMKQRIVKSEVDEGETAVVKIEVATKQEDDGDEGVDGSDAENDPDDITSPEAVETESLGTGDVQPEVKAEIMDE